jgi:hypothetical protein
MLPGRYNLRVVALYFILPKKRKHTIPYWLLIYIDLKQYLYPTPLTNCNLHLEQKINTSEIQTIRGVESKEIYS